MYINGSSVRVLAVNLVAVVVFGAMTPLAKAGSPLFENLGSKTHQTVDDYRLRGKWLVVMFWAHDCEVCEKEVGAYQEFHKRHADNNATVLGITLDGEASRSQAEHFIARHGLEFDNLIGEPEIVAAYYQIETGSRWVGTPSFLIFSPGGELMAKQAGAVEVEIVENFIAANDG